MSEILCNDCLDTGWIEDREGRSVCSCISETDPYQQLQVEVERLRKDAERYRWLRSFATWINEDYESIHYRWNAGEFESVDAAIDAAMREGE